MNYRICLDYCRDHDAAYRAIIVGIFAISNGICIHDIGRYIRVRIYTNIVRKRVVRSENSVSFGYSVRLQNSAFEDFSHAVAPVSK